MIIESRTKESINNSNSVGLEEMQGRLYSMLEELDKFCRYNEISYCLICGSALGAYRHHGFIPWDDDLDIAMDIEDFNKFCGLLRKKPINNLHLQSHDTDPGYLNRYIKVRDAKSSISELGVKIRYKENGCFIDVFPMEYVCPWMIKVYHYLHKPLFAAADFSISNNFIVKYINSAYFEILCGLVYVFRKLSRISRNNCYSYSYGCNVYADKRKYKKEWFKNAQYIKFGNKEYPVPQAIEDYLTIQYGTSFMSLPPENERINNHMGSIKIW